MSRVKASAEKDRFCVVIRHPLSLLYRRPDRKWSRDLKGAQKFKSTIDAVLFCNLEYDGPYQVMMKGKDDRYDIVVSERPKPKGIAS